MREHVLHVIESLEHGGAEQMLVGLAREQAQQMQVSIACLKRFGPLVQQLPDSVQCLCLRKGEGNDVRALVRLVREIRARGVTLVHTHAWGVLLEAGMAARWAGVPLVHTVHGPYLAYGGGVGARARAALRRRIERWILLRSRAVVAVSDSIAAEVRDRLGLPPEVVSTVCNGIEPAPEGPDRPDAEAGVVVTGRRGAPHDAVGARHIDLISVGRLAKVKNQQMLLRAMAMLAARFPRVRLRLVGDGPERRRLEQTARQLGIADRVQFLGFRQDVADLLAGADVFVISSEHEGISMAVLEAMRAGLPIVATRVGGVPETILDGRSGVLVPPGNAAAMARALELLVMSAGERQRLGEGARRRVREHFTRGSMVAGYRAAYGLAPQPAQATARVMTHASARSGQPGHTVAASRAHGPLPARALRILVHHRTQGRGAEGVHVASIVNQLRAMGHEVDVLSPPGIDPMATAGDPPVDKSAVRTRGAGSLWKFCSRHVPGIVFELAEIGYNVLAWWRLNRQMGAGYDLVYERYAFFLVAGAWCSRRRGVPFVLEANELSGLPDRARRQHLSRLCAAWERWLLQRCAGVIAVSSTLRRMAVRQGVDPRRVWVVPNAVAPELLRPVSPSPQLVARYGLRGRRVVGFAGWFDRWDRLDLLLRAVGRLRPSFPDLTALLIGDGPMLPQLRRQVSELGLEDHVVLAGAVPRAQMPRHLALLDVAVLPHSNQFGSPVVLFEMMARRLPIVAPRLEPIQDVLQHRVTALLFTPLNEQELAEAVERLLTGPELARRLGDNAYRQLLQRHTWRRNALRVLQAAGWQIPPQEADDPLQEVARAS